MQLIFLEKKQKTNRKLIRILKGSETALTNNEIKDIIKIFRNFIERNFLNFLRPLMSAGSPLTKNVLTA